MPNAERWDAIGTALGLPTELRFYKPNADYSVGVFTQLFCGLSQSSTAMELTMFPNFQDCLDFEKISGPFLNKPLSVLFGLLLFAIFKIVPNGRKISGGIECFCD